MSYIRLEKQDGIAVVWLDQPGEKINKLAIDLVDEFKAVLETIEKDNEVKGAVLISKKKDNFIAGADLERLIELKDPGQLEEVSRAGQVLLNQLEGSAKPIVAAIHGAALGGGLEVALACHYRIVSDSPKSVLGQPEVKLGLLPAAGATQRLPRLVGLQRALDIMLTGKNVYPRQARRMGLVDDLIHPYGLLDAGKKAVIRLAGQSVTRKPKTGLLSKVIEGTSLTRKIVYRKAREMTDKQTMGNYPAPFKIIECVEAGLEKGIQAGFQAESKAFEELAQSPQSKELIRLFFGITARRKNSLENKVRPVRSIAVLGAGFMGAGIANLSASNALEVTLKDINYEAVGGGEKIIWEDLGRQVGKGALSAFERDQIMGRISGVTDYQGFDHVDLVIEAVFEDLALKQKVLAETEAATVEECIFASNTSSLPITEIAAKAKRPSRVIGMHYFSPVTRMPLLEIIVTPRTAEWVTASAIEVGIRQGKTVIVVNDGPGFYTTRILAPMLNETQILLEEGGEIRHIDQSMREFGFPVGPITLIDAVGIDVGAHVSEIMGKMFAERGVQPGESLKKMSEAGYKGRKNGKGFYHYHGNTRQLLRFGRKRKEVNQEIYRFFGGVRRKKHPVSEIQERLTLAMVNEAAYCLQENILNSPEDGDLGAVLGLGFPPFLGGPFRYIDRLGPRLLQSMLEKWEGKYGARFAPAQLIRDYAAGNKKFYAE